ncbi:hypothetical protein AtDm6_1876 [Acetobacter tropicalis]|uniref:Uncharacterized protein n=1 Tax=Acetobacter tropicalis TaxID=104102 RepID=A0A094YNQ2_9PROT|nr:hypothetical protein AtDm6_1876 [Acetobacter tropicalis]
MIEATLNKATLPSAEHLARLKNQPKNLIEAMTDARPTGRTGQYLHMANLLGFSV